MIEPTPISEKDAQLVEHQLMQILASPYFKSAQQMQKFLKYVVRKTLAGQEKLLKQYTIAVEGLALPTDFDSDNNPLIRIIAGRVREKLDKYYDKEGVNDPLRISIAKGNYIPSFEKKGRTKTSIQPKQGVSRGPKLALVCFSDKTQNDTSNRLLFQLTDTLAKEFSRFLFSRLVVSIPHADKRESSKPEMKEKYNADFVLALYIHQLPKNNYELLYRLLDAESEEVLWSESFNVDNETPVIEQRDILGKITATITDLQQGILHIHWSRKFLENEEPIPKQYQALVYYRHYADNLGRGAFAKAAEVCAQALKRNPKDVVANVIYADYCRREYVYNYGVISSPLEKGKKCAENAVGLRADSHEAHFALGQILFCLNDWETSYDEFKLARGISKYHAVVEYGTGFHFFLMGKYDEGLVLANKAMSLSTSYPTWFHLIPFLDYYRRKKFVEALAEARKIVSKNLLHGPLARCVAYSQLGELVKAKNELQEVLSRYPNFLSDGEEILSKFFGNEELVEIVWDGVVKAST